MSEPPRRERPRKQPGGQSPCDPTDRGLSPVVGKALELGVGVLFVALLTATLFGAVAPDYRAAVGAELGDRTLAAAADRIEAAVPAAEYQRLDRRVTVALPATIRGDPYRIVATDGPPSVRLVHPDRGVGGRLRLDLPGSVTLAGSWRSVSPSRIVVDGTGGTVSVRLVDAPSADVDGSLPGPGREGLP
ncbi:DUF7266 family protein [Halobellus ruber]|uniref:Uncharacterized protein n=1 Tax=Halobellus ruber TaxID=2761102 RepID=A0A7J9SN34_9EURY|nr:hypothetical protein [Halobellus ruber]MBB6647536.1 hypothetical protein [Halobellus ruber]